jgi:5'-nucleotidase
MPDILLTNDDGYNSAGFLPLLKELSKHFSVFSITPDTEKSWIGKAITTKKELKLTKIKKENYEIFLLDGTPADCVQVGFYNILKTKPKLVLSGINQGSNVGNARILSSGTIGAAMEASIEGVYAIASSLRIPLEIKKTLNLFDENNYIYFENAAKITAKLTKILIDKKFDNGIDLFSINIPFDATLDSGIAVTKPFKDPYGQLFYLKENGSIFHKTPRLEFKNLKEGTDLKALSEGKISVTPISLDLILKDTLKKVEQIIKNSW